MARTAAFTFNEMAHDERWLGFGYLGEREACTDEAVLARADAAVIQAAARMGWTYDQLFTWANSKFGRWYGEIALHPMSESRNAAQYLPRHGLGLFA